MILPEWSDETINDILDYTYCDNVIFLEITYALSIKSTSVDKQMFIVFAPETLDLISKKDMLITNLFFSPFLIRDHTAPSSSVLQITPHDKIDPAGARPPSLVTKKVTASNVSAPAPWDPLNIYIVDINNSPEQFLKTVEQVVASRPPAFIILLNKMEELDISIKEGFRPNYRKIRDNSVLVA